MSRRTRIRLLVAASVLASAASIPASGLPGILLGFSGAGFALAALFTIQAGSR